ncbi:DUF6233 domain-containing protein [Streptomyces sp. NPDC054804]
MNTPVPSWGAASRIERVNELPSDPPRLRDPDAPRPAARRYRHRRHLSASPARRRPGGSLPRRAHGDPAPRDHTVQAAKPRPRRPSRACQPLPTRYIVERPENARQAAPLHTSSCTKGFTSSKPIDADLARQALVNDPRGFTACGICRPDTELGIDVA